jgi:D-mannonate dehydratase
MAITAYSQYMFLGIEGKLKQYLIATHRIVNHYQSIFDVCSVKTSPNSMHGFVRLSQGCLKQICIDSQTIIKRYHNTIHKTDVKSMAVTRDGNFLVTADEDGNWTKISIPYQKVLKKFCDFSQELTTIQLA